ncbi:MAG TPA: glycosyltransferase family A protein [Gemmatimonadales bacterium]
MPPHPPPAVTIVIPCYRQEQYLRESVESALGQSVPTEVIVVNDGSPGNPASVVRGCPVRLIDQPNQGLRGARNTGLAAAGTEFVIFLDADDRLLPGAAEAGLAALARHPDAILAAGRSRLIDEQGAPLQRPDSPPCPGGDHYALLLADNHIWPPAVVMYRREPLLAAGGWGSGRRRVEDVELYLLLARSHEFACHAAFVAEYRIQGEGLSADAGAMLAAFTAIRREQRAFVAGHPEYLAAFRSGTPKWIEHYGGRLVDQVRADLRARRLGSAARGFAQLARDYPAGARALVAGVARRAVGGRPGAAT